MKARASVDVVMAAYQAEKYVTEALESIAAQSHADVRVFVTVDGATDRTRELVERFQARPLRCVVHEERLGIAAARNRALAEGDAEFVTFLDADDLWTRDHCARLLQALVADPALAGAHGRVEQFVCPRAPANVRSRLRQPQGDSSGLLAGALMVRREAFERIGAFDTRLAGGEFVDWMNRARAARFSFQPVDALVLRRRLHGENFTLRSSALKRDYLEVVRRRLQARRGGGS